MDLITALVIGLLFSIAIFLLLRRNVIRSAIGLIVLSNAINLFLLSTGAYYGRIVPYAGQIGQPSDALPQALILTAIVISMGGFALVMGLVSLLTARYESDDMDDLEGLKK
jgi:multicomponent Na+:H+ antiporter subunit C